MKTVYIASCVEGGGIHRFLLDDKGKLHWQDKIPLDQPMYMTIAGNKMYIILRAPFPGREESGVVVCDIAPDGALEHPSEPQSAKGTEGCHILVDEGAVYCANYLSGSVIWLPNTLAVHSGHGPDPQRQEGPHVHFVGLTPEKKYICAVDLGLDTIFLYDKELRLQSTAKVPAGQGPRHLVFSGDGKYVFCTNELGNTVSAFAYESGKLTLLDTVPALPDGFSGENYPGAIRVKDRKIYVSNRGDDSIAELSFDRKLHLERTVPSGGCWPRDFDFVGESLIITNERGDSVCVRTMERVTDSVTIPTPLCVVIR